MLIIVETSWIEQVQNMVTSDEFFLKLNKQWEEGKLDIRKYQKKGGLFYYRNRILLSLTTHLRNVLIAEHHDTPSGGTLWL